MFKRRLGEKFPASTTTTHPLVHVDNFNKRRKEEEETVMQYYKAKMELADKVDPQMANSLRVAALIDGLPWSFRKQLAYKKTEMATPVRFLTITQGIEQEMDLIVRDQLDEQFSRLSVKGDYPTENASDEHMVTSIRKTNEEKQPFENQWRRNNSNNHNRNRSDENKWYNSSQSYQWQGHRPSWKKPEAYWPRNRYGEDEERQRPTQHSSQTHQRQQQHHPWQCFQCGEHGHIARFCPKQHLNE